MKPTLQSFFNFISFLDIPPKKRTRHKFPKPDEWVQNRRKRLRQEGKSYITRRGILMPEKQFSIKECSHCPLKCHEFFNPDELKEMFDNFWKMDLQNKRQYLSQLVEETGVKRVRTKSAQSRRSLTRHYYLIKNATQKKKVCRSFFMEVFKVSSNFIRTVCRKRLKSGIVEKDLRGKCTPSNKRPTAARDLIRNHINQFRRTQTNAKTGDREYLPSNLTLRSMHDSYVIECEKNDITPEKYWLYADIFHKDFNLHFRKTAKCNETIVVKLSSDDVSLILKKYIQTVFSKKGRSNILVKCLDPIKMSLMKLILYTFVKCSNLDSFSFCERLLIYPLLN